MNIKIITTLSILFISVIFCIIIGAAIQECIAIYNRQIIKNMKKDLEYWRKNAEENYLRVPISVLRYINELEEKKYKDNMRYFILGVVVTIVGNLIYLLIK